MSQYYEVYVASQRFHGDNALTYEASEQLQPGQVVTVPLQRQTVVGIVKQAVRQPVFATKAIASQLPVSVPSTTFALIDWLRTYYPAPLGSITQLFLPGSLAQQKRGPIITPIANDRADLPPLTVEQQMAISTIHQAFPASVLLHGVTGSGKTRVYTELVREQFDAGKSALVLTPEIGLTPQLVDRFAASFPGQVITVHSTLTPAERRDVWLQIAQARQPLVVIGPRSALFSPLHKLGLVVIDEAHDTAYKQEQAPYYQATRVAAQLARLNKAQLVLGSGTPLIDDYYAFTVKKLPVVRMTKQALTSVEQDILTTVVNLREREQFSRSAWLSNTLLDAINTALGHQEQALIFLNRRGTARLVLCSTCGWQALCPRCDLPLTYHGDSHHLQCHTCGYSDRAPTSCPVCGSGDITFRSIGTKALVQELERLFPQARIGRFDSDNKKTERLESSFKEVSQGTIDILVGTQVLSKGLDLPKLSVVGIVVADTSLYFPDYTAEEHTFQMLSQVMGRVGRGHRSGQVVVQTYAPDNPTIRQAIARDYQAFYEAQIKERGLYHFPPLYFVLKLRVGRRSSSNAEQAAHKFTQIILKQGLPVELSGPSASFIEKNNNSYFWQIILKAKQRSVLLEVIKQLPANWSYDIDPTNLL